MLHRSLSLYLFIFHILTHHVLTLKPPPYTQFSPFTVVHIVHVMHKIYIYCIKNLSECIKNLSEYTAESVTEYQLSTEYTNIFAATRPQLGKSSASPRIAGSGYEIVAITHERTYEVRTLAYLGKSQKTKSRAREFKISNFIYYYLLLFIKFWVEIYCFFNHLIKDDRKG